MANEQAARAIIKKLLNRSGFDAWYEDLDDDLQAEILAEMAGCIPAPPAKPEVVDGEVTEERVRAAVKLDYELSLLGAAPLRHEHLARAIALAESRGFAAGRASVTAKAEGWDEAAWAVEVLDAWRRKEPLVRQYVIGSRFGMVLVTLQKQGDFIQCWTGDTEDAARIAAARSLYAADPTLPAPPAPADTEPAKDPTQAQLRVNGHVFVGTLESVDHFGNCRCGLKFGARYSQQCPVNTEAKP